MFRICGRTLDEQRNNAVSYLNKLTQLLRPDAGYDDERDYWWVRNKDLVIRYTIQS